MKLMVRVGDEKRGLLYDVVIDAEIPQLSGISDERYLQMAAQKMPAAEYETLAAAVVAHVGRHYQKVL